MSRCVGTVGVAFRTGAAASHQVHCEIYSFGKEARAGLSGHLDHRRMAGPWKRQAGGTFAGRLTVTGQFMAL